MDGNNKVTFKLELEIDNPLFADIIIKSLSPDNIGLPEGVEIRLEKTKKSIIISVTGPLEKLLSIKNTIEDIILSLIPIYHQDFVSDSNKDQQVY